MCVFLNVQNCPPFLCVLKATIYRQNVAWALTLVPQLSFFVNLIFLVFLNFSYQHRLECIPKIFENLNSFEMMLKMLKTMQIY